MMLAYCFTTSAAISLALTCIFYALSFKPLSDKEKKSPFECGFTPKSNSRFFFSLQFFLVTVIFLIFDVELVLMFPILSELTHASGCLHNITLLAFILILSAGLAWEWSQTALEWGRQ